MSMGQRPPDPVTVDSIRLPALIWLDDHATVRDVARMMCNASVSAVIIGERAEIVTERDLVRALAEGVDPESAAALIASPDVLTVPDTTSVVTALAAMLHAGVRHVVVIDPAGVPCAVLPLAAAAAAVLGETDIPSWLTALRIVLRVEAVDR
jgi:signal-transduction protein with cAMP-binding, CBS, and nucleotidyltransferase domain